MTKIAIAALNAESDPYAFGQVVVRLVDAGSGGAVDGGVIVAPRTVKLDEDGEAEVDLTPTAEIDPPGTCYAFTVVGVAPTVVRYLEVPSPNIVGPSEVPYAWDDPSLQVVFAEPPTFVPAPGSGEAGEVLTLVDDGDGKRYELRPATGGAATDAELDVAADAPMLKSASASATYEAVADLVGVAADIKAVVSEFLPVYFVTEPGETQDEINNNASGGIGFALGLAGMASTEVVAETARATAQLGGLARGAGAPGANFTSPDPYLLVGAGSTPDGYQANCYRMPAVTATFDDGVDFVGDAVILDGSEDGFHEASSHGRLDIDYDRAEPALLVEGGLVSIFGEYGRVGDPEVDGGEYAPGRIFSKSATPPVVARVGDRIKWRWTVENDRGDGHGRVRLWEPTLGVPDETAHGVPWRITEEIVLDEPTSVSVVSDYWYSGMGQTRFGVFEASWYEYGGAFSHRFHPDDLQLDDTLLDPNGNVATPLGDATVVPGSAGGGLELGETSTTAYRGDRGKTAYDHSQVTGNPHGTTAADVGAATTAQVTAALDVRFPIHRAATTSRRISSKGAFAAAAPDGMTTTGDRVYTPLFLPAGTYNTISVRSTTANTATWRLGIFNGATGDPTRPGTVLKDAGTIDLSVTAAMLTLSSLDFVVPADGWYWCCAQVETYTSTPQVACHNAATGVDSVPFPGWPGQESNYLRPYNGYQDLSPSAGALTTASSITGNAATGLDYAANVPRFWVGP